MRWSVELSKEAAGHLEKFQRKDRERLTRAINEFEAKDDFQWTNIKALQGSAWKGRFRKRVGPFRIIFQKFPDRGAVEISAVLTKSKGTYRQ